MSLIDFTMQGENKFTQQVIILLMNLKKLCR